jgi:hypothetical protein
VPDLTEQEAGDLAYQHRGEVVEGSGVAVEPRRLDATTPAALDIDRIRAAVEASKPPGWARGELAWRRDTVALLAEVERLRTELAPYRPPLSGMTAYPTYEQIAKAWQDTLDQQDGWRQGIKEQGAELEAALAESERLRAQKEQGAELEAALAESERLRAQVAVLGQGMHTVWLHSKWRWLTQQMTTEEREAAWAAVKRYNAAMDPDEPLTDDPWVWWRDTAEVKPV